MFLFEVRYSPEADADRLAFDVRYVPKAESAI
jgi:hypothetical protein